MKAHYVSVLALLLVACGSSSTESEEAERYNQGERYMKGLEIRVLSEQAKRDLGVGPEDLVSIVTDEGTILFKIDDREFREADLPDDIKIINSIQILTTPGENPTCKFFKDDVGNRLWYPSPPCPIR